MLMTIAEEMFLKGRRVLKIFEHAASSLHCFPSIDA